MTNKIDDVVLQTKNLYKAGSLTENMKKGERESFSCNSGLAINLKRRISFL